MLDGRLFTRDFLLEGICETSAWQALDHEKVAALFGTAKDKFEAMAARRTPNEAQTEDDLVSVSYTHLDVYERQDKSMT